MNEALTNMIINSLGNLTTEQLLECEREYERMECEELDDKAKLIIQDIQSEIQNQLEMRGN